MYREFEDKLINWKNKRNHKPLVIIGARQVGKTYTVEKFGRKNYRRLVIFNFQDDILSRDYFASPRSAEQIITYIEVNNTDFEDSEDVLIFFDEVQLCPEILTALKFLHTKLRSDVICTGSMLGVKLQQTSSWPVGYVEMVKMHPMGFVEFLMANGIDDRYIGTVKQCVNELTPVDDAIHIRFSQLFIDYMVCGGLPEAVKEYVTGGIAAATKVNRRLINDYRVDIAHYADGKTKIKAQECFDSIPNQLAKENKKFQYNVVKKGYNARHYDESLKWLEEAGLVTKTYRLSHIVRPIISARELAIFKIYMFDSGLLAGQFTDRDISEFLTDNIGMYKGMMYENVMAQMIEYNDMSSFYYEPNTSSEIDFIIDSDEGIIPIEVKGGLHIRSRSFDNFVRNYDVKKAYRFSAKNVGVSADGITYYLPIYSVPFVLPKMYV